MMLYIPQGQGTQPTDQRPPSGLLDLHRFTGTPPGPPRCCGTGLAVRPESLLAPFGYLRVYFRVEEEDDQAGRH